MSVVRCCLLLVVCCLLFVIGLSFGVWRSLIVVVRWSLVACCCLLFVVCCLLLGVGRALVVVALCGVRCPLPGVRCCLSAVWYALYVA